MTELVIRVPAAATLIWLGMVLAISFVEAPLKFHAEGLELRVGLAIGRIVFRALNIAEVIWAVVIAIALCLRVTGPSGPVLVLAAVTAVLLAAQLLLVRPRLNRRSAITTIWSGFSRTRTPLSCACPPTRPWFCKSPTTSSASSRRPRTT